MTEVLVLNYVESVTLLQSDMPNGDIIFVAIRDKYDDLK